MIDDLFVRFVLSIALVIVGLVFLYGLYTFGVRLFGASVEKHFIAEIWRLMRWVSPPSHSNRFYLPNNFQSAYDTYLAKRNDFWEHYGQLALAILIVVVLAILLLTKAISAEAGLPILSAVAGFAIAKTNTSSPPTRRDEPTSRGPDE